MFEIKNSGVVAVFLGTKSSLLFKFSGDDIENGFDVPLYPVGNSFICTANILKKFALKCGRPLWSFLGSFEEAYDVPLNELKCELYLFELTCFILRTGSSVVPQDELAHKLVLSGMATLLHVDNDG